MSLPTPSLPSTTGAYTISAGGLTANLPPTISSPDEAVDFESYSEKLQGRDGLFPIREPDFRGRTLQLTGYVMDPDTVRDIKRVVSNKRIVVTRDSRNLVTELDGFSVREVNYGALWRVSISLTSFNYFWEAASDTVTGSSPTTVTNNGDTTVYPVIDFSVGAGGATIVNVEILGRTFTWTATAASGQLLRVDFGNSRVTLDGTGQLDYVNSAFFTNPPRLAPGSNALAVSVTGTVTWSVSHREQFL